MNPDSVEFALVILVKNFGACAPKMCLIAKELWFPMIMTRKQMAMIWKGTKTNYLMEIKSQKMLFYDKENWQKIRMIRLAYLCASPHGEFRLKPISLNPSFLMQSEVDIM